ncbi:MAG TPA: hypothetical protein VG318_02840 [Actinomycetota bacterium]|nr:hypothetical protein [Actinomycetota bacterium]
MQFIRDLRAVTGELKELVADDARHEEDAKLELAVSAQHFAQETREVVDDKLSFSATLMRAGEVDAAKRLLAEVEAEVRDNEVALIEQVNEVKVARAARRERITRMRLARSLAVAMLGAAVMATSAAGMAFANFLEDRSKGQAVAGSAGRGRDGSVARAAAPARAQRARSTDAEKVRFKGVTRVLTPAALAAYQQLTSGDVDAGEVEHLLSLLPDDLAHTVRQALTTAKVAEKAVKDTVAELVPRPSRPKAKAAAKDQQEPAPDQTPKEEPTPEPKEEPSPTPSPTEEPEEDPDDPDTMGLPGLDAN